jgi:hypothetical protein
MGASRRLRAAIYVNVAALLLLASYVLSQAFPSSEAVRLRNALLIETGSRADFEWAPEQMPRRFKAERRAAPAEFVSAVRAAGADGAAGDREKALALAGALTRSARDGGPIQSDLASTYSGIVGEGRGYCADFTNVYLALANAAGLTAREWGFSFDGFGGHGHAIVEVFDRQLGKWMFLDVFNNVQALDRDSGMPLSALEFRDYVLGKRAAPAIVPIGPGRAGYKLEHKLVEYYRQGAAEWYLWLGNNVYTYDAHPLVRTAGRLSRPLEQLAAMAVGVHPGIMVLAVPENEGQRQRMARLKRTLTGAALAAAMLLLVLAALVTAALTRLRLPVSGMDGVPATPAEAGQRGRSPT